MRQNWKSQQATINKYKFDVLTLNRVQKMTFVGIIRLYFIHITTKKGITGTKELLSACYSYLLIQNGRKKYIQRLCRKQEQFCINRR